MAKAAITQQLMVEAENTVGMLAAVSDSIAAAKVNIIALCAYGMETKAYFYLLTSDNGTAKASLIQKGYRVSEEEVVTLMLEDKIGQAQAAADKIKTAGVDLDYMYGSACGCAHSLALLVIKSKDNAKTLAALNS